MTEWWQVVLTVIVGLGLSPAPWVTALLLGRLIPKSWHTEAIKRVEAREAVERERADIERERADTERGRADAAGRRLVEVALELGSSTVKLLESLPHPPDNESIGR